MKIMIDYGSDVHLDHYEETYDYRTLIPEDSTANSLLIAGDVATSIQENKNRIDRFFGVMRERYSDIFMVLGNHDYWGSTLQDAVKYFKGFGVTVLDCEGLELSNNIRLYGGTMWTKVTDPSLQWMVRRYMNDSRLIFEYSVDRINREYDRFVEGLKTDMSEHPDKDFIVCSHHAPSVHSVPREFMRDPLNCAYCNNDAEFIFDFPQIKAWVHGHVHKQTEYTLDSCEVKCKPRGYPNERYLPYTFSTLML